MPILEMSGVHFAHPGGRARLVDVRMRVEDGDVVCLLGPNGAGKTTLLRLLLGLLRGARGHIAMAGVPVHQLSARERARLVAYVPQSANTTFPFTALDMAVMGRTPHVGFLRTPSAADRRAAWDVLADLGIERLADQSFGSLSGGERALTLMARAVVQEARMLVLDEPTAALDVGNSARVLAVVRTLARQGRAVVMTTHDPDQALREADQALLLQGGRIVAQGPPTHVLTSARLSEVYGTPVEVGMIRLSTGDVPACVPLPASPPVAGESPILPASSSPTLSHP